MDDATLDDYLCDESDSWSWEQNKAFENALATHAEDTDDRWEKIAAEVPGKDVDEVVNHYRLLEEDVVAIDGDQIPLPSYSGNKVGGGSGGSSSSSGGQGKKGGARRGPRAEPERRKGVAWSEEEHR